MMRSIKLWQYILLAAMIGVLPMTGILLFVISTSVNKDINFGLQEMKGDAFQRPLEQLLDLFPRYQAAAARALAGDESAKARMADVQQQIESQLETLSANYKGGLGRDLKFNDAELGARKRDNARLSVVLTGWQNLKKESLASAAGGESTDKLVASTRAMIAHAGDLSNLILDSDLDSYYLMDVTLCALPQTQQRLSDVLSQVGGWIRSGTAASKKADIAVMAAMLQQDDQDRITGDAQTTLNEDKNFHGLSESLQKNLPAAIEKYTAANQAFIVLLNRVIAGENVPAADFEASGWNARDESLRLWQTSVDELDVLLATRVTAFRHSRLLSLAGIAATFASVVVVIWFIVHRLNASLRSIVAISEKVAQSLSEILTKVRQVDELVAEVSGASREQTQGITQINSTVGQMDKVTQNNAASAEESAAAAEELNAQAATMKHSVLDLLQLIDGDRRPAAGEKSQPALRGKGNGNAVPAAKRSVSAPASRHVRPVPARTSASNGRGQIPLENDFRDF